MKSVSWVPAQYVTPSPGLVPKLVTGSFPAVSLLQGIFLTFLHAPGRLFVPRERLGSENLGILLSLPSRMRPVLCPHQVSKCPDELADFTGDCSAALRPSFGGAVFCLPAPRTRPGSPCPWTFLLLPGPPLPCMPVQGQLSEMAGVNSCLGGRGDFRPFFVRG